MIVSAPMNEIELRNLMYTAQLPNQGPFSIRYPRGKGVTIDWKKPFKGLKIGKGVTVKEGSDVAILSIGHVGNYVIESYEKFQIKGIDVAHYNMIFVKPLDEKLLHKVFQKFEKIVTIEDGCIQGGFGSAVIEFMSDNNYKANVVRLGIPDQFINHGTQEELHKECLYDAETLQKTVVKLVTKKVANVG
jgi:1-deoxy-D-xylulose-5-phosphate synthase